MSALPRGLYDPDFPSLLFDIEISHVNFTSLPPEVARVWHAGMFLVLECLQLPDFPEVLTELQPGHLSLASSNFSSIPDAFWDNPYLAFLSVNNNPLRELPTRPLSINSLFIDGTQITMIPPWLNPDTADPQFMAGSTPLCDALQDSNISALGLTTEAEMEAWRPRVNCTPIGDLRYFTQYLLVDEAVNNPSRIN